MGVRLGFAGLLGTLAGWFPWVWGLSLQMSLMFLRGLVVAVGVFGFCSLCDSPVCCLTFSWGCTAYMVFVVVDDDLSVVCWWVCVGFVCSSIWCAWLFCLALIWGFCDWLCTV